MIKSVKKTWRVRADFTLSYRARIVLRDRALRERVPQSRLLDRMILSYRGGVNEDVK